MTTLESANNVNGVETSKRAEQSRKYGMWYKEGATPAELVSWCDERISTCNEWIKNCKELKQSSQTQLLSDMPREALEAALAALNA